MDPSVVARRVLERVRSRSRNGAKVSRAQERGCTVLEYARPVSLFHKPLTSDIYRWAPALPARCAWLVPSCRRAGPLHSGDVFGANADLTLGNTAGSMRYSLLSGFSVLITQAAAQSLPTQETLAQYFATRGTDADANTTVQGQTLQLYPFDLSILTNESHALISFNISKAVAEIGYVAVGFGSSMQDASMVLLWPSQSASNWTISHRCSSEHSDPKVSVPSGPATPPFTVVPDLSVSTASGTSVSFIRPITLPSDQTLYSHAKFLNLSRSSNSQRLIYAFTKERPATSSEDSDIAQHDSGSFGSTGADLTQTFIGSKVGSWQKFDTVVLVHGLFRVQGAWRRAEYRLRSWHRDPCLARTRSSCDPYWSSRKKLGVLVHVALADPGTRTFAAGLSR